ncbi:hypothetical protein GUITHDRAFT_78833 [Guillardia theta CCMP2712]|uniref:Anaphase-promoting complex subunit 4 WD40 domain-containing protein n=1 Tax=Guillardia theta (strain CCMP2712) TaxID=905079 RepID=L1IK20_GUITC|nr:hypothetical protein GUITHDRAFT_78833 [Guillardia theta CCMP2712]EKX36586.1 hypothetical protein GUITHDRAFT_78833 [Guillardia theta CCMP2712]|eukprot:XP_005823566.1 hypothetical protein GUITHDRAFT_78833 [Guillardia theta CCMP2712]
MCFGPDEKTLALELRDSLVEVWEVETGELLRSFPVQGAEIQMMSLGDGKKTLTLHVQSLVVTQLDVVNGKVRYEMAVPRGRFTKRWFAMDGKTFFLLMDDGTMEAWDVQTGEIRYTVGDVVDFDVGKEKIAAILITWEVKVWDIKTGQPLHTILPTSMPTVRPDWKYNLLLAPNGNTLFLFTLSGMQEIMQVWDVETGEIRGTIRTADGSIADKLSISEDGRTVAFRVKDGGIEVRDVESGELRQMIKPQGEEMKSFQVSPDGTALLLHMSNGSIKVWDISSAMLCTSFESEDRPISQFSLGCNGRFIAFSFEDGKIQVWDVETAEIRGTIRTADGGIADKLSISEDGRTVAFEVEDGGIEVRDVESGELRQMIKPQGQKIIDIKFGPQEKFLALRSNTGRLELWNVETGQYLKELKGDSVHIDVVFVDGSILALSPQGRVEKQDFQTGPRLQTLSEQGSSVINAIFSPNEKFLALLRGDDRQLIEVWDIENEQLLHPQSIQVSNDDKAKLEFGPNGDTILLYSGNENSKVRLWNRGGGKGVEGNPSNVVFGALSFFPSFSPLLSYLLLSPLSSFSPRLSSPTMIIG